MTTVLDPAAAPYLRPVPEINSQNRQFFDALKDHVFLVPQCDNCHHYNWVPYPACRSCLSEQQTWTPVSGDATLYTFTVCHRGPGAFGLEVPYTIALGELVEQPRPCLVIANVVGIPAEELRIGMPIKIAYQEVPSEDMTLYRWVAR